MKRAVFSMPMKPSRLSTILIFPLCALITSGAWAAAPLEEYEDMLVPTSGWLVGPASLLQMKDGGQGMPCVAMNQFSNGGSLRISGGGKAVLAMALDYHAPVFKSGESYDVSVSLPPTYLRPFKGVAYNASTLIVSVAEPETFYQELGSAKTMIVTAGQQTMSMALLGLGDGMTRLETCYKGGAAEPRAAAVSGGMKTYKARNASAAPRAALPETRIVEPDAVVQPAAPAQGEVMPPPGVMGDTPAQGQAAEQKPAPAPVQAASRFHVTDFLKTETLQAAAGGEGSPAQPGTDAKAKDEKMSVSAESTTKKPQSATVWTVTSKASLQETLQSWADRSGVELVWKPGRDYEIPQNLSFEGPFETAVLGILSQYESKGRPLGRLYRDPQEGRSVLLIDSE